MATCPSARQLDEGYLGEGKEVGMEFDRELGRQFGREASKVP